MNEGRSAKDRLQNIGEGEDNVGDELSDELSFGKLIADFDRYFLGTH